MLVRCVKPFRDLVAEGRPMRSVGETWEADSKRLCDINAAGYGKLAVPAESHAADGARAPQDAKNAPSADELSAMTVRELTSLCIAEGVEVKGKPRKAELVSMLAARHGLE